MQIPTEKPNATRATAASGGSKPTILFVDDEERILRSLRMLFAQRYNVKMTTDGYVALRMLAEEKIHVLVSDQRMPVMAGVDLLRQAKDIAPNTMRLLLTGYSDMESILGSINEGEVFRFISKPWDAEAIKATVASAVEIAISLDSLNIPAPPAESAPVERILVIDENRQTADDIRALVHENISDQLAVDWASNLDAVLETLRQYEIAVVIAEARLGDVDITTLIKTLKRFNPRTVSILLTAFHDASTLVGLINQAQIFRYIPKPLRRNLMLRSIEAGLQSYRSFQLAPALVKKHAVESEPETVASPLASKIMGFFRAMAKQRA